MTLKKIGSLTNGTMPKFEMACDSSSPLSKVTNSSCHNMTYYVEWKGPNPQDLATLISLVGVFSKTHIVTWGIL